MRVDLEDMAFRIYLSLSSAADDLDPETLAERLEEPGVTQSKIGMATQRHW